MDDCPRFTTEQVLRGIQTYLDEQFGVHLHLNPEASVSEYYEIIHKRLGCPLLFLCEVSTYFGLRWDERRWAIWLKLPRANRVRTLSNEQREEIWQQWLEQTSQPRTIRSLAEFISQHAKGCSMAPSTLFGIECGPAGAFQGICRLPEVGGRRLAPSTSIRATLGASSIESMLRRASWVSGTRIKIQKGFSLWSDPLPCWLFPIVLFIFCVLPMLLGAFLAVELPLPPILVILGASAIGLFVLWKMHDRLRNPLPHGVRTFGDLARLIANAQTAA